MPSRSEFALRFAFVSALLLSLAGGLAAVLLRVFPVATKQAPPIYPPAFLISTVLLLIGSVSLWLAYGQVRRERQKAFRRYLLISLAAGTLFVASQTYALTSLIHQQRPEDVELGASAYIVVMASLHAMHFIVAMLFLVFVTVRAFADRYDHEYYWGVTICAWFWHVLGVVWLVVLAVIGIASLRFDG